MKTDGVFVNEDEGNKSLVSTDPVVNVPAMSSVDHKPSSIATRYICIRHIGHSQPVSSTVITPSWLCTSITVAFDEM